MTGGALACHVWLWAQSGKLICLPAYVQMVVRLEISAPDHFNLICNGAYRDWIVPLLWEE